MTSSDIESITSPGSEATVVPLGAEPEPGEHECLLCYVYRVLGIAGCDCTLRWATHWRDARAPRARGLLRGLQARGGHCDCEIFLNGWEPREFVVDDDGVADYPEVMPPCPGVTGGSGQPCRLWVPIPRVGRR